MTFAFDQPVDVTSILALEATSGAGSDWTYTATGGSNTPVVATIVTNQGTAVPLNWTGVTAITVTTTDVAGSYFAFDNLLVGLNTLYTDDYLVKKARVYPNPVENMLYVKNISDLKLIDVYNYLGQKVLQTKEATINVSQLSQGMYLLKIHTISGTETKRIIKK